MTSKPAALDLAPMMPETSSIQMRTATFLSASSNDLTLMSPTSRGRTGTTFDPAANASAAINEPNYDSGQQTHSTIAELSEAFRMFTSANNVVQQSHIAPKDLMAVMAQVGLRPSERDVAAQIQVIDQRQQGVVTFDEFASLMGRSVPMTEVDSLQAAFWAVDKERTGWISSPQFCELMASHGERSPPDEVSEMLAFADPAGTGRVNYRVFLRMLGMRLT
jgi:Ca2+-binding EF-hand superfamily protein